MKVCEVAGSAACWTVIPGSRLSLRLAAPCTVIRSAPSQRTADASSVTLLSYFLYFRVLYRLCSTLLLSFCRVFGLRVELGPVSRAGYLTITADLHTVFFTS